MGAINLKNLNDYTFVLASQSPRRAQLLATAGYQFTVVCPPTSVEDEVEQNHPGEKLVLNLARAKGQFAVDFLIARQKREHRLGQSPCQLIPAETIVIAADTVAECENSILGKPRGREHAEAMLKLMAGRQHRVLTGVSLWLIDTQQQSHHIERLEVTTLVMDHLDECELENYLSSGDWEGKAGAFGYQDGLDWVHIVDGLASNVVGLPVERLPAWMNQLISRED